MRSPNLARARQSLLARRRNLLARHTGALSDADQELHVATWGPGMLERIDPEDARALTETLAALERLDDGRVGICLLCQGPIEAARLAGRPETTHCAQCLRLVSA